VTGAGWKMFHPAGAQDPFDGLSSAFVDRISPAAREAILAFLADEEEDANDDNDEDDGMMTMKVNHK
jgi:hypothetical protein